MLCEQNLCQTLTPCLVFLVPLAQAHCVRALYMIVAPLTFLLKTKFKWFLIEERTSFTEIFDNAV